MGFRSRYRKAREEGSGNSPRASMGFSKPRIGFSRDWEIYRDEDKSISDERRPDAQTCRPRIAVSFCPAIPRRVASQQSPLPLRRMRRWNQGYSAPSSLHQFRYRFPHAVERTGTEVPDRPRCDGDARVEHFRTYPDSVHWPRRRGDSHGGICSRARSQSMLQAARTRWYSECGTALATRERTRDAGWRSGRR